MYLVAARHSVEGARPPQTICCASLLFSFCLVRGAITSRKTLDVWVGWWCFGVKLSPTPQKTLALVSPLPISFSSVSRPSNLSTTSN